MGWGGGGWMDGWRERQYPFSLSSPPHAYLKHLVRVDGLAGRVVVGEGGVGARALLWMERGRLERRKVQVFDGLRGPFLPIFHPLLTWRTWASAVAYTTGAGLSAARSAMVLFFGSRDERENKSGASGRVHGCALSISLRSHSACVCAGDVCRCALICVRACVCPHARARKCGGGRRSKLHK